MDGTDNLLGRSGFIPQALNALDRLTAARSWSSAGGGVGWWGTVLLLVVLLAAGAILAVTLYRRWQRNQRQKRSFELRSSQLGLGEPEKHVLMAIARSAKLRDIEAVFTVPLAFERGLAALMRSSRVTSMSEDRRRAVSELGQSVREKLGLEEPGGASEDFEPPEPSIGEGDQLTVIHRGQAGTFDANVAQSGPDGLLVEPNGPVACKPGETWLVRYSRDGMLWEFDAPVVGSEAGKVRLARLGQPRFINRRRFPRVVTHKEVHVASFPFWKSEMKPAAKDFVAGKLTEIAGPGLRLEAPLDVKTGDRVLLALKFGENNVVESLGKVRRSIRREGQDPELVVELLGLSSEEIAKLTRETNAAAQENVRGGASEAAPSEQGT